MDEDLTERIRGVLADVLEVEASALSPASSPSTIEGWDSLRHVNMVIALEQEFGIQFSAEEIEQAMSVEAVYRLVAGKVVG
jgi:acyl carrier protein